jgi:hypothetical protein
MVRYYEHKYLTNRYKSIGISPTQLVILYDTCMTHIIFPCKVFFCTDRPKPVNCLVSQDESVPISVPYYGENFKGGGGGGGSKTG